MIRTMENKFPSQLRECQSKLMTFSKTEYPLLYNQIHKTRLGFVAYNLLHAMAQHDRPLYIDSSGIGWYAEPLNFLVKTYGGSKETWQSNVILMVEIGLLKRIKPDSNTLNPVFAQIYRDGLQQRKAPKAVYSVPEYDERTLQHAEMALKRWKETGVATSHITKASAVNAIGQAGANTIYRDGRSKGAKTALRDAQTIIDRICHAVRENGYTTKLEATQGKESAWNMMRGYILDEAQALYKRPTAKEVEWFHLPNAQWIIRGVKQNERYG